MTLLRVLVYMLAAWIGGVWVALTGNAWVHHSWTTAWTGSIATVALAAALAILLARDLHTRRLTRS